MGAFWLASSRTIPSDVRLQEMYEMAPKPLQRRYVAYYRVSTERQGRSGLGLEAQKQAVQDFLHTTDGEVTREFTEVQSGKDDARPQLAEALKLCRLTRTTLLIAKLDRLSRNVAFLATLQESGIRFVCADNPQATELVVHVLAAVAQAERKAISERTRAALAAAKRRGVRLGNPRLVPGTRATARIATAAAQRVAKQRAEELRDVVSDARVKGHHSLRQIAAYLNQLGITSARGGQWRASSVRCLQALLGA
jgi:DNA invertase Pin-like site-specific DNA recombinase